MQFILKILNNPYVQIILAILAVPSLLIIIKKIVRAFKRFYYWSNGNSKFKKLKNAISLNNKEWDFFVLLKNDQRYLGEILCPIEWKNNQIALHHHTTPNMKLKLPIIPTTFVTLNTVLNDKLGSDGKRAISSLKDKDLFVDHEFKIGRSFIMIKINDQNVLCF